MRIAEIYKSVQGEGRLTGTPSVFVRTSGCNLRCHFCDTPHTSWFPEGDDLSQGGWGLLIGLSLGIEAGKLPPTITFTGTGAGTEDESFDFLIRPVVGFEIPEFNPGTATFSSFTITGSYFPPLFLTLNLGGTFQL